MTEVNKADFDSILNTQMDGIEKPKPLVQGKYRAIVRTFKYVKSPEKGTPGAEVTFKILNPIETEDDAAANLFDYSDREVRQTYWLTKDALHRAKEFLEEHCKIHGSGRLIGEVFNDVTNAEVGVVLVHNKSKKNDEIYANVQTTFAL